MVIKNYNKYIVSPLGSMGGGVMENTIYTLKDYGKVDINLKQIIEKKNISRSKLSTMTALNYDLVNRYFNNKVNRVDLDVIARFCFVLKCDISDILKFSNH